jgi:LysM repeat protein
MDQRTRRNPARFLAPLALIAVIFAFLAILSGSGGTDDTTTTSTNRGDAAADTRTETGRAESEGTQTEQAEADRGPRFYRVQVGDTLGGIADKTGVPLDRIEELNPDVDPQAMTAGQRIKLR